MTIEDDLKTTLIDLTEKAAKKLREPTRTWRHTVIFLIKGPFLRNGDLVCQGFTDDAPYFWLDGGAVRRARMSHRFRRKTNPKSFTAGVGAPPFDPVYISKRTLGHIQAREWTSMTAAEFQPRLEKAVDTAMRGFRIGASRRMYGKSGQFGGYTP